MYRYVSNNKKKLRYFSTVEAIASEREKTPLSPKVCNDFHSVASSAGGNCIIQSEKSTH
jgi:hypothetical protein